MIRMTIATSLIAALLAAAVPAAAASFDCAKASTAVEKEICTDPALSRLDEELAEAYRQALAADPEPDRLKGSQRIWLRDRRDACVEVACLRDVYRRRIARLDAAAAFAATTGPSEAVLADFIRAELKLEGEYSRPQLVPLRPPTGSAAAMVAFFGISQQTGVVRRGFIDVSGAQPQVLGVEDYDECHCQSVTASSMRLVATEPDFVVVQYSPRTGTCVAVEQMDIFRIGEDGTFEVAWKGEIYSAGSPELGVHEADVSEISFPPSRHEGRDRAILRSTKQVKCSDDDCFCRDGPLIREYLEVFFWDPATKRFRPAR